MTATSRAAIDTVWLKREGPVSYCSNNRSLPNEKRAGPGKVRAMAVAYLNPISPDRTGSYSMTSEPHRGQAYSHSIVPGGLLVMSYVTRLIPRTSFTIRVATRARNAISNG